jgi:signal transduction histidine kinase
VVPVIVEGRRIGTIGFDGGAGRSWEPVEIAALSVAAAMLGAALRTSRAQEAVERREAILDAVSFAAERFMRGDSFDQALDDALERLGLATGVSRIVLVEQRPGPGGPHMAPRAEWDALNVRPLVLAEGSLGYTYFPRWLKELSEGRLVAGHVRDFPESERTPLELDGVRSIVVTPVFVGGRWWGHVGYDDGRREREWGDSEIDALRAAAGIIGAAIQQAESLATIVRRTAILSAVADTAPHLLATERADEVLPILLQSLLEATKARSAWAYELQPDDSAELIAERVAPGEAAATAYGRNVRVLPEFLDRLRDGEVLQNLIMTADPDLERAVLAAAGIRSFVMVPVVSLGRSWGVIGLDSRDERTWTEGEVVALRIAAAAVRAASEREASEGQLRQFQKMEAVARLAGGLAHDFGNLLAIIQGHAQFLRDAAAEAESRDDAESVLDAAQRGAELVRSLMTFSRGRTGEIQPLDLNVTINRVARMLQRAVGPTVTIDFHPDASPADVSADPAEIEHLIVNLVVNARDAMPDGGTISIGTSVVEGPGRRTVELAIADSGTGMDDATRARIFEPFFTTKPEGEGTGLGLATAYGTVTAWGGSIEVDSALGVGTTFRILLPAIAQG